MRWSAGKKILFPFFEKLGIIPSKTCRQSAKGGPLTHFKKLLISGFFVFSTPAFASPVQIHIQGLRRAEGSVFINLFNSASSWSAEVPDQVIQVAPLRESEVTTLLDLAPGTYAFFLFHDEDGNGDLRRGTFGLPGEPYAFSNNVHIGLSKPSFKKLQFVVTPEGAHQNIKLIRP